MAQWLSVAKKPRFQVHQQTMAAAKYFSHAYPTHTYHTFKPGCFFSVFALRAAIYDWSIHIFGGLRNRNAWISEDCVRSCERPRGSGKAVLPNPACRTIRHASGWGPHPHPHPNPNQQDSFLLYQTSFLQVRYLTNHPSTLILYHDSPQLYPPPVRAPPMYGGDSPSWVG